MADVVTVEELSILTAEEKVVEILAVAEQGPRGIQGPPGPAGGNTFEYQQTVASLVWTVPHNLGRRPSVVVTDGFGELLIADVGFPDSNIVQITHGAARTGIVYCN